MDKTTEKRKLEDEKTTIQKKQKTTRVVRLKRSKGQIVQNCDVYIGRRMTMGGWNLSASKWANPFTIKEYKTAEAAIKKYKEYLLGNKSLLADLPELKGKVLGCWCKPAACHGDVLVELVNKLDEK